MSSASFTTPTVYEQPHLGFGRHESCPHSQLLFNRPLTPFRLREVIKSLTNSSLNSLVQNTPPPRVLAITLPSDSNLIATACRVFNGIYRPALRKERTIGRKHGEKFSSLIRWLKGPSKYEFDDEFEYLFGKSSESPNDGW